jgi:hypothetical protein
MTPSSISSWEEDDTFSSDPSFLQKLPSPTTTEPRKSLAISIRQSLRTTALPASKLIRKRAAFIVPSHASGGVSGIERKKRESVYLEKLHDRKLKKQATMPPKQPSLLESIEESPETSTNKSTRLISKKGKRANTATNSFSSDSQLFTDDSGNPISGIQTRKGSSNANESIRKGVLELNFFVKRLQYKTSSVFWRRLSTICTVERN